jgi:hypothetical protein
MERLIELRWLHGISFEFLADFKKVQAITLWSKDELQPDLRGHRQRQPAVRQSSE